VPRPADADAARFALDPSVAYWANFTTRWSWSALGGRDDAAAAAGEGAAAQVNAFARRLAAEALTDATSAAYWAYHLGRTAFFVGEGIAGLAAHHAYETFVARGAARARTRTLCAARCAQPAPAPASCLPACAAAAAAAAAAVLLLLLCTS